MTAFGEELHGILKTSSFFEGITKQADLTNPLRGVIRHGIQMGGQYAGNALRTGADVVRSAQNVAQQVKQPGGVPNVMEQAGGAVQALTGPRATLKPMAPAIQRAAPMVKTQAVKTSGPKLRAGMGTAVDKATAAAEKVVPHVHPWMAPAGESAAGKSFVGAMKPKPAVAAGVPKTGSVKTADWTDVVRQVADYRPFARGGSVQTLRPLGIRVPEQMAPSPGPYSGPAFQETAPAPDSPSPPPQVPLSVQEGNQVYRPELTAQYDSSTGTYRNPADPGPDVPKAQAAPKAKPAQQPMKITLNLPTQGQTLAQSAQEAQPQGPAAQAAQAVKPQPEGPPQTPAAAGQAVQAPAQQVQPPQAAAQVSGAVRPRAPIKPITTGVPLRAGPPIGSQAAAMAAQASVPAWLQQQAAQNEQRLALRDVKNTAAAPVRPGMMLGRIVPPQGRAAV